MSFTVFVRFQTPEPLIPTYANAFYNLSEDVRLQLR